VFVFSRRTAIAGATAWMTSVVTATAARGQQTHPPLAISAAPNDSSGLLLYAQDLGWFKSAGLDVSLMVQQTAVAALAGGAVTIAGMPVSQVALAREKGIPFVYVAPLSLYVASVPDHALIVARNAPYQKAADLNGKTIATRDLANLSYFGAAAWLDKNGGDSKSVHWYELPDNLAVAALQAGRIDAASISEPALDPAMQTGQVRSLGTMLDAIAPRFLIAGCTTTEDYAKAHPEVIRSFAGVIAKTAAWANANHAKSGAILSKYTQVPVAAGATRAMYADRLRAADVQPVLDLLFAVGQIKTPAKAADLFSSVVAKG
jgi:ABC-type nitrate/sulfonate/bicarbonate transport system substrate-binding protein